MKKYKILFWVTTGIIAITQGVIELFLLNDEAALKGIMDLGYPAYFFRMLVAFKVVGSLVLIIPKVPARIKEWAYAGFGIDFISAFVSVFVIGGLSGGLIPPVIAMVILSLSYFSYHKMNTY